MQNKWVLLGWLLASCSQAITVVLDTGHSKDRPGALSASGYQEYAYNQQLADLVWQNLTKAGVEVIRPIGSKLALIDRTKLTEGAALFVSIHHDSIQQEWIDDGRREEFSGFAVFVSRKNKHFVQSAACGKSVGTALVRSGEKASLYHSTPVKGENRPILDKERGLHQFDDLIVLKTAKSPAILVEAGVIANPGEEIRLADPRTAGLIGQAIAYGVIQCLNKM